MASLAVSNEGGKAALKNGFLRSGAFLPSNCIGRDNIQLNSPDSGVKRNFSLHQSTRKLTDGNIGLCQPDWEE